MVSPEVLAGGLAIVGTVSGVVVGQLLQYKLQVRPERREQEREKRTQLIGQLRAQRRQVLGPARRTLNSMAMQHFALAMVEKGGSGSEEFNSVFEEHSDKISEAFQGFEIAAAKLSTILTEIDSEFDLTPEEQQMVRHLQNLRVNHFSPTNFDSSEPEEELREKLVKTWQRVNDFLESNLQEPSQELIGALESKGYEPD